VRLRFVKAVSGGITVSDIGLVKSRSGGTVP
jgi:hypothetical protein